MESSDPTSEAARRFLEQQMDHEGLSNEIHGWSNSFVRLQMQISQHDKKRTLSSTVQQRIIIAIGEGAPERLDLVPFLHFAEFDIFTIVAQLKFFGTPEDEDVSPLSCGKGDEPIAQFHRRSSSEILSFIGRRRAVPK